MDKQHAGCEHNRIRLESKRKVYCVHCRIRMTKKRGEWIPTTEYVGSDEDESIVIHELDELDEDA